ncbi:hypothetical protein [Roseiarcus sp.]
MAVESAALRPEQFWVAGSIAGALQTAHAVCAPTWAASWTCMLRYS